MSGSATAQRCPSCDGVQPLALRECDICGERLDGSAVVTIESAAGRRFARAVDAEPTRVVSPGGRRFTRPTTTTGRAEPTARAKPAPTRVAPAAPTVTPPRPIPSPSPAPEAVVKPARPLPRRIRAHVVPTVIGGAVAFAGAVVLAALATYDVPGADSDYVLRAAAGQLWPPVVIGAAVWWWLTFASQFLPAHPRLQSGFVTTVGFLLSVAAGGVCVYSAMAASGDAYVPAAAWTVATAFAVGARAVLLLVRSLATARRARGHVALPFTVGAVTAAGLLAGAGLAGASIHEAAVSSADIERLSTAAPLGDCSAAVDPSAPVRGLARAEVGCRTRDISGEFVWLRDRNALELYASARAARQTAGFDGHSCKGHGSYKATWHEAGHERETLGELMCFSAGRVNRIEWSDSRTQTYGVARSRRPMRNLYKWWRHHRVAPLAGS